jgi:hypothetical protein
MSSFSTADFSPRTLPSTPVSGAYVIEVDDVAAGVLVRDHDAYRFFAASRDFHLLEGGVFRTPHAAQKAAERMQAATRPLPVRSHSQR